jgi:Protein of unknown function (DUF3662)/FHA domain
MLARFERLMEQAVEGSLRRVFPTTVQPVQLAKAAARAMEQAQVIGVHGPQVPNSYRLRLAPVDARRFADYRASLSRELSQYLIDYARERGLRPIGTPVVELFEDASLRAGTVRADARFVDLPPELETEVEVAVEGTRRLRLADLAGAGPRPGTAGDETLWLVDRLGLRFALEPQVGMVRVGRAVDNDLVIANQRVSRYHAQLRRVESSWLVYDLDSTNGTWVNAQRVLPSQPHAVEPDGQLRFGDHELELRAEAAPPSAD